MKGQPGEGRSAPITGDHERSGDESSSAWRIILFGLALLIVFAACVRFGMLLRTTGDSGDGLNRVPPEPVARTAAAPATSPDPLPAVHHDSPGFTEPQQQDTVADGLSNGTALDRLQRVLAAAGSRERQTATVLAQFASSGSMAELRALDRADVAALAAYLADELSAEDMSTLFQQFLGLPSGSVRGAEQAESSLVGVYDAVAGNHTREVRPSVLTVTDAADGEGRITGQSHVLPAGTGRVYAVFENDRALGGLDQVLAVWRDPNDDKMVFTEFEPVRKGSAYNFVWLEVESGWPAGRYQVELFHPEAQSLLLASEGFSVR